MKIVPAGVVGSRIKPRLIVAGSHADEFAECFGKVALIRESDPIADLAHAQSPPGNELLGMFDADKCIRRSLLEARAWQDPKFSKYQSVFLLFGNTQVIEIERTLSFE